MKGTVTVTLEDFRKLEAEAINGHKMKEDAVALRREVDRVLTYINQSVNMAEVAKSYNQLSDSAGEIIIQGQSCTLIKKNLKQT